MTRKLHILIFASIFIGCLIGVILSGKNFMISTLCIGGMTFASFAGIFGYIIAEEFGEFKD